MPKYQIYLAVTPHDVVRMKLREGLHNGPYNLRRSQLRVCRINMRPELPT